MAAVRTDRNEMSDALVGYATKFSRVGRLPNPTSSGRWNNVKNLVDLESDWFTPPLPTQEDRADYMDLCQHFLLRRLFIFV